MVGRSATGVGLYHPLRKRILGNTGFNMTDSRSHGRVGRAAEGNSTSGIAMLDESYVMRLYGSIHTCDY